MLKEQGKGMFEKYRALEKHLEEQKDSEGLKLFISALKSTSKLIKGLIDYNIEVLQYCNEITKELETEEEGKK